jgi:predicted nucleic acid-binding Zn ribbon protein
VSVCIGCGHTYEPGARRCSNCGADLLAQPQGITQSDVFWAVLKAGLALLAMQVLIGIALAFWFIR